MGGVLDPHTLLILHFSFFVLHSSFLFFVFSVFVFSVFSVSLWFILFRTAATAPGSQSWPAAFAGTGRPGRRPPCGGRTSDSASAGRGPPPARTTAGRRSIHPTPRMAHCG